MIDLPNRATWIVTANNPHLSLEIARRCVRIRLDAKTVRCIPHIPRAVGRCQA
jgi:hypothetical protein